MVRRKRTVVHPGPFGVEYGPKNGYSSDAASMQAATWQYRTLLEAHVMNRFEWKGLPDTISERYLERVLMRDGQALAFISESGLPMAMKGVSQSVGNYYGDPVDFEAFGENGWKEMVPGDRGVWIWENQTRYNHYPVILRFAQRLGNLDILQDVNRDQQRQVVVFAGSENNQQDLAHIARAMRMSEKSVIVDKKLLDQGSPVSVLATGVKYLQDEFNADKRSLMNEFFDYFGIEHIAFEKNAHMLETEATITNDSVARIRENSLLARQEAAEKMSELFDTEITVEWRKGQFDILNEDNQQPIQTTTIEGE